MFKTPENGFSLVSFEHEVLDFWEKEEIFRKLRAKNSGKPRWSFLDGPITANNPMGVHHAWGRTLKDCYQRFHAMTGHELRYQNGFDCQGLWVEVEVEKSLGFSSKKQIEEFGLEKFINACKERVNKYSKIQTQQSIRLGYWMDWDNSYFTMSDDNNYAIWEFIKKCHERGLIYKGLDAMPWCARCGTGISEQERREGYKRVVDKAVYVKMKLHGHPNESLLVWTTTPWTLAANVACAVNPEMRYVKVKQGEDIYYLHGDLLHVLKARGNYEVLEEFPGSRLVGLKYDGIFQDYKCAAGISGAYRVVPWTEVSATDGTGIVHIAPGCGKEDFLLSKEVGLPILSPIDDSGIYVEGYGPFTGKKAGEVTEQVFEELRKRGNYYKKEDCEHDYPHCWRCGTPLLFRTVGEWFISMSWRDEIKKNVEKTNWIPSYGKELELDWLNNMHDWMISKKRYWGLALPIYHCECGHFDVIGSREELRSRAVEGWDKFEGHSPHRPWLDAVKINCSKCGRTVSRIPDVGNPWLDAGIVPYSTVKYSTDKEYWKKWVPADLVIECFPGQFRNWFYALLSMSTMMENISPFKTLLGYALVRDEHGEEMHKSKGNTVWFDDAVEKVGADAMRWMYCHQNPVSNLSFGYNTALQQSSRVFNTWWNAYSFFLSYADADGFDPAAPQVPVHERQDLDRWILSRLQEFLLIANDRFSKFEVHEITRAAESLLQGLSTWYIRRSRRRFWRPKDSSDKDKLAAYQTLYTVLVTLCKALAPVVPFLTEKYYRHLVRDVNPSAPESVHLCDFPQADKSLYEEKLVREMDAAMEIVSMALGLRKGKQLRVRLPLSEVVVCPASEVQTAALAHFKSHILEELNIKQLRVVQDSKGLVRYEVKPEKRSIGPKFGKDSAKVCELLAKADPAAVAATVAAGAPITISDGLHNFELKPEDVILEKHEPENFAIAESKGLMVAISTLITPELEKEGCLRDLIRQVQQMRKEVGLQMGDQIEVSYDTRSELCNSVLTQDSETIKKETLCVSLVEGVSDSSKKLSLGSHIISLAVRKVGG